MGFKECMDEAVRGKEIKQLDADDLINRFNRLRREAAMRSEATADAEAKAKLERQLAAATSELKRRTLLSIRKAKTIDSDIAGFRNSHGEKDVAEAVVALIEHHQPGGNGRIAYTSVDGARKSIIGMAHAELHSLLAAFKPGRLVGEGFRLGRVHVEGRMNRAVLANVVRELFGQDSGDAAAKGLAQAWSQAAERLRQRFNAAGGSIGKLENWGLPQWHDPVALRKAGEAAWIKYITPMLDISRMRRPVTGDAILPEELPELLHDVWRSATTDGWDMRKPSMQLVGKGAVANQRAEHRFLVFKDSESWLKYQADFGGGSDPFAAMMGHLNGMAGDIAAMERFGPNPDAGVEYAKQLIQKEAARKTIGDASTFGGKGDIEARVGKYLPLIDNMWASERGTLNTPVNGFWAGTFAGLRDYISSTAMGAAMLSSGGDAGTSLITRRFAGIGGSVAADLVRSLLPGSRGEATEAGLILDSAMHVMHAQARYVGTLGGPQFARFLSERTLHFSGLTAYTQAGKHAFGLAFMREVAKQASHGYAALNPLFRQRFAQYGIGPAEWDTIRSAEQHPIGRGVGIVRPREVQAVDGKLAERYLEMIQTETQYAVPEGSHRSRVAFVNGNQPGTIGGEILRGFAQFKSFGAVFAMLHGQRIHAMLMAKEQRALGIAYASSLAVTSTLFGALALQLKSVAGGRDPRDMLDPKFWAAAGIQGAGFGILGDFLFADVSRDGGGLAQTIAGPSVERADSFRDYVASNAALLGGDLMEQAQGKPVDWGKLRHNFGASSMKILAQNVPGGNVWWLHLAAQRILLDQLNYLADPEANKAFKTQQQYWSKNFGQDFWWQPGQAAPARAPNVGAMAGG